MNISFTIYNKVNYNQSLDRSVSVLICFALFTVWRFGRGGPERGYIFFKLEKQENSFCM